MANGVAALHALAPDPDPAPAFPADQPAEAARSLSFDERFGGAEGWIGAIVVEIVDMAFSAAREIQASRLAPDTRLKGGDLLAALVVLQANVGEREFAAAVHRVGRTRHGAPLDTAMADDIIEAATAVAHAAREMN